MTLFPISLMLAVIIINPVHLLGYCIALFFSGILWFTLHSLIVVLMYFRYQRNVNMYQTILFNFYSLK